MSDTFFEPPYPLSPAQRDMLLLAGAADAPFVFPGDGSNLRTMQELARPTMSRPALVEPGAATVGELTDLPGFRRTAEGQRLVDARAAAGGWR